MVEKIRKAILEHTNETINCVIDITNKCNLKCKHCFYYKGLPIPKTQLTDNEWLLRVYELKKEYPTLVHCVFLGGEPMLRYTLIKGLSKFFEQVWVVTNGTFQITPHHNVGFLVSVDGIKEHHEELRGKNYDKIKRNISGKNVYLNCTITKRNMNDIPKFIMEWKQLVKGIRFSFYQPVFDLIANMKYDLNTEQKHKTIEILHKQKSIHKNFILNIDREFELYRPEHKAMVKQTCAFRNRHTLKIECDGKIWKCPIACPCSQTSVILRTLMKEKNQESIEQFLKVARNG